ncbi:MAG: hypothetical protein ACREQ4_16810 [Candidatus Binataceae bacterium]
MAWGKPIPMAPGFAPDLSPLTPGLLRATDAVYPTVKGYRALPALVSIAPALPSACVGAYLAKYLASGIDNVFAGTAAHLYLLQAGAFVENDGGQNFNAPSWSFAQFGNDTIATDLNDVPQVSANGAAFTALGGGPPNAAIVAATNNFVFLLNWGDANSNKIGWSGIGNDALWSFNIADQSGNIQLQTTPGPITAGLDLQNQIIAYKGSSVYAGTYSGNVSVIWGFAPITDATGVAARSCVINLGDRHIFVGPDDFYICDGYSVANIPENPIKEWFFGLLDATYAANVVGRYDQVNRIVYWHFPSITANPRGTRDHWVAWNSRINKWAMGSSLSIEAALPELDANGYPAVFKTDHSMWEYSAAANNFSITSGDIGDVNHRLSVFGLRPLFAVAPATATLQAYARDKLGGALIAGPQVALNPDGTFRFRQGGRFQSFTITASADTEIVGYELDSAIGGLR